MPKRYQAPLTLASSLADLREKYQTKAKVDFKTPASSKFSIFFGATDLVTRQNQINLLEAVAEVNDPCRTGNDKDAYFDKYHLMVALSLITQQQIFENSKVCPIGSELHQLINESLNLKDNPLDQHTINECMYTFKKCDKQAINQILRKKGQTEYSETQWQELKILATKQIQKISNSSDSPIADSLSYVGGLVMRPIGWGIGFSFGQTLGKIGTSGPAKAALTTAIGSAFIFLGPIIGGGMAAATLLARSHAEQAVEYAIGYGCAEACGYAFKGLGQGVGYVVGKGVDLTIDATSTLTKKAINIVSSGEVVSIPIKIGLDLVSKDVIAQSDNLSHEDFIEQIQEIVSSQEEAIAQQENSENNIPIDIIEPKVIRFDISKAEQERLKIVLKTIGYTNNEKNVGLLESVNETEKLINNEPPAVIAL